MTETTALTTQSQAAKNSLPASLASAPLSGGLLVMENIGQVGDLCGLLIASGYLVDKEGLKLTLAQCVTKVLFGQKMGLDPLESINDLYMFQGQCAAYGRLHARKIDEHPHFAYKIVKHNAEICIIRCYKSAHKNAAGMVLDYGEPEPDDISFTYAQAQKALWTEKKYTPWSFDAESMLFNKCIARAYRRHFPGLYRIGVLSVDDIEDGEVAAEVSEKSRNLIQHATKAAKEKVAAKAAEQPQDAEVVVEDQAPSKIEVLNAAGDIAEEIGEKARAEKLRDVVAFRESEMPFPGVKAGRPAAIQLMKDASTLGYSTDDLVAHLVKTYPNEIKTKTWTTDISIKQISEAKQFVTENRKK